MTKLKTGDSVVVKANITDPDLNANIGGWQGRMTKIDADDYILINWDSLTLTQMPNAIIDQCEVEGMDWSAMYLYLSDVQLTNPRDNAKDVELTIKHLESVHQWSYLGEEGIRIQAVLSNATSKDRSSIFEAWKIYFKQTVSFPLEGEMSEYPDRGPLKQNDKVKLLGIENHNDYSYGILVALHHNNKKYVYPLHYIKVTNHSSASYQPIQDYKVWIGSY